MKAKIIIVLLLFGITSIGIYCQTTEPTVEPVQVGYPTRSDYYINQHQNDFNISTPFLGWMWFSKPVISAMFYANQAHIFGSDEFEHNDWLNNHYCKSFINTPNLTVMSNLYYDGVENGNQTLAQKSKKWKLMSLPI